jgi:hypothetical protein
MPDAMKPAFALLLMVVAAAAFAQDGRPRARGAEPRWGHAAQRPMAPGGEMSVEQRQHLRDELRSMRRERWRGPHASPQRGMAQPMGREERERLRRDIREANREMAGRRR